MPSQPPENPALRRLLDLRGGKGRRSTLYLWMRDNREALAADIARNGAQWAERARLMGEAGLLDRTGKPPTVRGAMQTWYRVCDEAERKGATPAAAGGTSPAPSIPPAPGKGAPTPRPFDPAPVADTDNPYGFRTAGGVKDWTKKGPE